MLHPLHLLQMLLLMVFLYIDLLFLLILVIIFAIPILVETITGISLIVFALITPHFLMAPTTLVISVLLFPKLSVF